MRLINLYIARKLCLTTFAAIGVLTFSLLSGNLVRVFDLLARGVSPGAMGEFFLLLIPDSLKYTIPVSLLCAVILVFSHLAADNEITAMRATGIGLWQIVSPALILAMALSGVCFWLQMSLGPACSLRLDQLKETEGARNPLAVLEPGRFVELPGYIIYVGRRSQDQLRDLHVYGLDRNGKVVQDITAREGTVRVDEEKRVLELILRDAIVVAADPADPANLTKLQHVAGQSISFPLDYGSQLNKRAVTRRLKHMNSQAVFGLIHAYAERGVDTTPLYLDLHRRMSMALSPFAFLLIGIPFGIRARRSEAAVGIVITLVLATVFYVFMILADNLKNKPDLHPEILVWVPNVLYQVGGLFALSRLARH